METKELRDGAEDEDWEWLEEWEEVEGWEWEEVGGSGSGDEVLPGGGAAGDAARQRQDGREAMRHGDDDATRSGELKGRARRGSDEVTRHGGREATGLGEDDTTRSGELKGQPRRGSDEATRHGGREATGLGNDDATRSGELKGRARRGSGEATRHGGLEATDHDDDDATRSGGEVTLPGDGEVAARGRGGWFDYGKRTAIAAGARVLFYPTLATNFARNKLQSEFHWWDRVDENVILGAVPFRRHVPKLKSLGVTGVVTLTESFETLVPKSDYEVHGIDNLSIPTADYSAAPSIKDIWSALSFMKRNASRGNTTYVHCKAGRGRSTTIVLCYLIKYRNMSPQAAWNHTRSIRPRVSLTRPQHEAVTKFSKELHGSEPLCEVLVADRDLIGYQDDDADKDVSSVEDIARHQSYTSKMPDP